MTAEQGHTTTAHRLGQVLRSPYVCMGIVIAIYVLKSTAKIVIGGKIGSVAVRGDGFHNISDIVEAFVVIFAVYLGRRPPNKRFPLGLAAIENILGLQTGLIVLLMGLTFLRLSTGGILHYTGWCPALAAILRVPEPGLAGVVASRPAVMVATAVVAISFLLSLAASRYQIWIGKSAGYPSLVSDGKESLSDSLVELSTIVGVIGAWIGIPWLDAVAGLLVSGFILKTGFELIVEAGSVLLNVSAEKEKLDALRTNIQDIRGVRGLGSVLAYTIGKSVFVVADVTVDRGVSFGAVRHMRTALEARLRSALPEVAKAFFTFIPAEPELKRCLVGIGNDRGLNSLVADDFLKAKNYVIANVSDDSVERASIYRNDFDSVESVLSFIREKQVDVVIWSQPPSELADAIPEGVSSETTSALTVSELFSG